MPFSSYPESTRRRVEAITRARAEAPTENLKTARVHLVEACKRVAAGESIEDVLTAARIWHHYEAEFLRELGLVSFR